MKVAVAGAGVSGLACAITLQKYGIVPDVFEQLGQSGGTAPFHGAEKGGDPSWLMHPANMSRVG